ncbi:MAG: hypothetical protein K2Q11_05275 [Burkholderiaceae bacterium]|nr:hypothetical protein [Burkholderiaceae bacterium]
MKIALNLIAKNARQLCATGYLLVLFGTKKKHNRRAIACRTATFCCTARVFTYNQGLCKSFGL